LKVSVQLKVRKTIVKEAERKEAVKEEPTQVEKKSEEEEALRKKIREIVRERIMGTKASEVFGNKS
jgi:hypothetical protein